MLYIAISINITSRAGKVIALLLSIAAAIIFIVAIPNIWSDKESDKPATPTVTHDKITPDEAAAILGLPSSYDPPEEHREKVTIDHEEYRQAGANDPITVTIAGRYGKYDITVVKRHIRTRTTESRPSISLGYSPIDPSDNYGTVTTKNMPSYALDHYPKMVNQCTEGSVFAEEYSVICITKPTEDQPQQNTYVEYHLLKSIYNGGAKKFLDDTVKPVIYVDVSPLDKSPGFADSIEEASTNRQVNT